MADESRKSSHPYKPFISFKALNKATELCSDMAKGSTLPAQLSPARTAISSNWLAPNVEESKTSFSCSSCPVLGLNVTFLSLPSTPTTKTFSGKKQESILCRWGVTGSQAPQTCQLIRLLCQLRAWGFWIQGRLIRKFTLGESRRRVPLWDAQYQQKKTELTNTRAAGSKDPSCWRCRKFRLQTFSQYPESSPKSIQ